MEGKSPVKIGVSIDFFDTLVEIDEDVPTLAEALTSLGYPCSPAVENIWNSPGFDGQTTIDEAGGTYEDWRRAAIAELALLCGVPDAEIETVTTHLLKLDRQWTVRARPGAHDLIATINGATASSCILTNWDYPLAPYLEMAGFDPAIPAITSAEIGIRKPNVEAFAHARARMQVSAAGHIHIGDSWTADVAGAIRSGAQAIWVTDTRPRELLPERIVAAALPEVPKRLLEMMAKLDGL